MTHGTYADDPQFHCPHVGRTRPAALDILSFATFVRPCTASLAFVLYREVPNAAERRDARERPGLVHPARRPLLAVRGLRGTCASCTSLGRQEVDWVGHHHYRHVLGAEVELFDARKKLALEIGVLELARDDLQVRDLPRRRNR